MGVMETTWIVVAYDSRLSVFEIRGYCEFLHQVVDFLSQNRKILSEKDSVVNQPPPLAGTP